MKRNFYEIQVHVLPLYFCENLNRLVMPGRILYALLSKTLKSLQQSQKMTVSKTLLENSKVPQISHTLNLVFFMYLAILLGSLISDDWDGPERTREFKLIRHVSTSSLQENEHFVIHVIQKVLHQLDCLIHKITIAFQEKFPLHNPKTEKCSIKQNSTRNVVLLGLSLLIICVILILLL